MMQLQKRLLAMLLSVLLLCGGLSVAGAAFDPATDDGTTVTMAMKWFRKAADGSWIETDRAKPGEALKLRFYAATDFATNAFRLGFAYDRQFFTNSMAQDTVGDVFTVNPALPMLESYNFYLSSHENKENNSVLKSLLKEGRLTQADLEANDYVTGSVEWLPGAVNAMLPADTWIFELDSFAVAENDYVRTPGQTGAASVPAELGQQINGGRGGIYGFSKGEAGASIVENYEQGLGWTPTVTSTPAVLSACSSVVLKGNGGAFNGATETAVSGPIGAAVTGLVEADALPTRYGYTFAGYARTADGAVLTAAELNALTYDYADQTLYAQWTRDPAATVYYTYDAGEGTFADGTTSKVVTWTKGEAPAAFTEAPSRPGFRFLEWDNDLPAAADRSLTFSALYEPLPCTVRMLTAEGEVLDDAVLEGGMVIKAADLPEGYKSTGWVDGEGNPVTFPYAVTHDADLIAPVDANVYSAYFYVNDELYAETRNVYEAQIAVPADPEIEGYTFLMWDPDPDGIQDTEEQRFDAVMEQNSYTVYYYYYNTPAGLEDPAPVEDLHLGDAVPLPQPPAVPGYTVSDWALMDDAGDLDTPTVRASDVYASAYWQAIPYTVTYVYTGDVPAGVTAPAPVTAQIGDEIALPEPAGVDGYVFDGWTLSGDADGLVGTQDVTVTGQWSAAPQTYTVTLCAHDGAVLAALTLTPGDAVTAADLPEGYKADGWTDGSGSPVTFPYVAAGDETLTASAGGNLYSAYFYIGDTLYATAQTVYGAQIAAPADPAQTGYDFLRWNPAPGVQGTETQRFHAVFAPKTYTLIYNANGGFFESGATLVTAPVTYGAALPAQAAPMRDGYTFTGWAPAAPATMPAQDLTLAAQWSANNYTVYYYYNNAPAGVEDPAPVEGLHTGDAVPLPAHPAAAGYTVTDWALMDDAGDLATPQVRASDVYASAEWTAIPYTVTYVYTGEVPAGVTAPAAVTAQIGDEIALPEPAAVPGYVFEGWTLSGDADGKVGAQDVTATGAWARQRCTVTLQAADGSVLTTLNRNAGEAVTAADLPAGYRAAGWTDGSGTAVTFPYTVSADVTLTAPADGNVYNAYFYVNDALYATVQTVYGAQIAAPADPTLTGCRFTGWTPALGTQGTEEAEFRAVFETLSFTLTYDANGGVFENGAALATASVAYGAALPAQAEPTRPGYTFAGWDPAPPAAMPAADLTLTAQWSAIDYTVYYYYNNAPAGVEDPAPVTGLHTGDAVALPVHPAVAGYTVTDWALMDDAGDLATPQVRVSDVYVTAEWQAIPYTVTYVYTGEVPAGVTAPAAVTAQIGDEIALPDPAAVPGYVFDGWTLSGDADGKVGAQDVTATGIWSRETFRVTYAFDGQIPADAALPAAVDAHTGDPVVLPEITAPAGYTFAGWTLVNDDNGKVGTKPVTAIGSWQIHTHTATFLDDAGNLLQAETYAYGAAVPAPQAPAKIGFRFVDWYSETAGVWSEATVMGDADLTFTARYAEHAYTVTYLANGAQAAVQTVAAGAATDAPAYTAPEGYGLQYWADAQGAAVAFPFTPAADTTLTAALAPAVNGLFYAQNAAGEAVITGLEFGRTAAEIPAEINGSPVTGIADGAFAGRTGLTSVTIPKSVTAIGENAFAGCTGLTDVTYGGTQEAWDALAIGAGNEPLLAANLHCHVHAYTAQETRPASCTQPGLRTFTCSGCGESYTEEIPMIDHVHGYWVIRADAGVREEICTVCGAVLATEPYEEPPVVTPTPQVKIRNNPGKTTLPYRYSILLTAETADLGAGQAIAWYVDGTLRQTDPAGQTTATFKLSDLRAGVTVTVKIVDANSGAPVTDQNGGEISDTEAIQVNNGFFARVIGFFRSIFGRLRTVEQMLRRPF